jgi:hypothetical protein
MAPHRRWRRAPRRGISEIIGAVLLVSLSVVSGVILWSFKINLPPPVPSVSFVIHSGGSNPVWGDPTDCQPWGYGLNAYNPPMSGTALSTWSNKWNDQCENTVAGNFSELNSSEFVISAHSPNTILLSQIDLTFVCNNASSAGGQTILVNGSLASMTWFPGVSSQPAANAPYLGYCGTFDAGSTTAANGIYYNRLGLFVPLQQGVNALENGDTFILYIHNGGYPLDFECVANSAGVVFDGQNPPNYNGCVTALQGNGRPLGIPTLDYDDYHGAPPWCFTSVNACTIYLTYTGTPATVLARIPVFSLAPPTVV